MENRFHTVSVQSCLATETTIDGSRLRLVSRSTVSIPTSHGVDWKGLGYLTSIASVLFLGAVASLKENPPWWYYPALITGMATSILGMAFRYKSHLDQQREIRKAEAEAEAEAERERKPGARRARDRRSA